PQTYPLPALLRLPGRPPVHPLPRRPPRLAARAARGPAFGQVTNQGVTRHVQDIRLPLVPQPAAEVDDPAELVVGDQPGVRQLRLDAVEQGQGQPPTLLEGDLLGDVGPVAVPAVRDALLAQIQPGVEQGLAAACDISDEVAELAVVHLAYVAAP